jgi:hypothetical protein
VGWSVCGIIAFTMFVGTGDWLIPLTTSCFRCDIVAASVDYTLPANGNVESLYMLGSGLTGTGSDHADTLLSSGGLEAARFRVSA